MTPHIASAASRGALKVLAGHYDGMRVILACRTRDDFMSVTRIPRHAIYGESGNAEEVRVAMGSIGTPFARPLKSLADCWIEWYRPTATQRKQKR